MRNIIVQYNETYATEQFMTCMIKNQSQLGVEAEIAALVTGQNIWYNDTNDAASSISSSSSTTTATLSFVAATTTVASGMLLLLFNE